MEQKLALGKYPIFSHEVNKNSCKYKTASEIVNYLKTQIDNNPMVAFIVFLIIMLIQKINPAGGIPSNILDIKNIVFCFGPQVPNIDIVAVRPRSIGITELANSFVINFMEAPAAMPNQVMMGWVQGI